MRKLHRGCVKKNIMKVNSVVKRHCSTWKVQGGGEIKFPLSYGLINLCGYILGTGRIAKETLSVNTTGNR